MRTMWLSVFVVLGLVCAAKAAPLDLKQIPANTTWVVHVDVDAMRASTVVQKAYAQCLEKHGDKVEVAMEMAKRIVGMDPRTDLHGLTAYGPKLGEEKGVLLIFAEFDRKMVAKLVKLAPDYKESKYGQYYDRLVDPQGPPGGEARGRHLLEVRRDGGLGHREGRGAGPRRFGRQETEPAGQGRYPRRHTVVARAWGIADAKLPCKSPLPKQIEGFAFAMGEHEGQSFLAPSEDQDARRPPRRLTRSSRAARPWPSCGTWATLRRPRSSTSSR